MQRCRTEKHIYINKDIIVTYDLNRMMFSAIQPPQKKDCQVEERHVQVSFLI